MSLPLAWVLTVHGPCYLSHPPHHADDTTYHVCGLCRAMSESYGGPRASRRALHPTNPGRLVGGTRPLRRACLRMLLERVAHFSWIRNAHCTANHNRRGRTIPQMTGSTCCTLCDEAGSLPLLHDARFHLLWRNQANILDPGHFRLC